MKHTRLLAALFLLLAAAAVACGDRGVSPTADGCPPPGAPVSSDDVIPKECRGDPEPRGIAYGTVIDIYSRKPIPNGTITFVPDDPIDIGYAFSNGRYKLTLEPNTYKVTLTASGYNPETKTIEIVEGEKERVDFFLEPPQSQGEAPCGSKGSGAACAGPCSSPRCKENSKD